MLRTHSADFEIPAEKEGVNFSNVENRGKNYASSERSRREGLSAAQRMASDPNKDSIASSGLGFSTPTPHVSLVYVSRLLSASRYLSTRYVLRLKPTPRRSGSTRLTDNRSRSLFS